MSSLPSIFNLVTLPIDFISTIFSLKKAIEIGDKEAEAEASHRLTSLPLNMAGSLTSLATFLYQIGTYFKGAKNAILKLNIPTQILSKLNVIGFALSAIESIIELCAVKRLKNQLGQFHLNTEEKISTYFNEVDPTKKRKLLTESLNALTQNMDLPISSTLREQLIDIKRDLDSSINPSENTIDLVEKALHQASRELLIADAESMQKKYLKIAHSLHKKILKAVSRQIGHRSTKDEIKSKAKEIEHRILEVKINKLARRVSPLAANELKDRLPGLLRKAKHGNDTAKAKALKEIKGLLQDAKIQTKKYLITHIISLCIFAATTVISVALMVGCPPTIPAIIMINLSLVSTINYLAERGTIKQKGWKFSFFDALPTPIQWICNKTAGIFRSKHAKEAA